MAAKKLGALLKEARTNAGLTQEALAKKVGLGLTATAISKVERDQGTLTQEQLKKIAKVTGVTQTSLLEAAKSASGKTTSAKTSSAKTPANAAKTSPSKPPANANSTMKVTSTERKLVEAYRAATAAQKRAGLKVLKGECDNLLDNINGTNGVGTIVENLLGSFFGGSRELPEDADRATPEATEDGTEA